MSKVRSIVEMVSVAMVVLGAGVVAGQDFPNKPIRIVTGPAGGGTDTVVRLITPGLSSSLGQPVIVDNRGGNLPGEIVSRAPPDGYTLLIDGRGFWLGPLLQKMPYDPVKDFAPISIVDRSPSVLLVHPSLPVKSVKELIALAKARPGELNYASGQTGTSGHLATELFKAMAGVNIVRINYKGSGAAVMGVVGGEVQLMVASSAVAMPHVQAGKLRALGVTSDRPSALVPGVPTVAASLPGYEATGVDGIFAPAKTPARIINRLNLEIVRILKQADVKEKLFNIGLETAISSPEEFTAMVKSDIASMGKLIKDLGLRVE